MLFGMRWMSELLCAPLLEGCKSLCPVTESEPDKGENWSQQHGRGICLITQGRHQASGSWAYCWDQKTKSSAVGEGSQCLYEVFGTSEPTNCSCVCCPRLWAPLGQALSPPGGGQVTPQLFRLPSPPDLPDEVAHPWSSFALWLSGHGKMLKCCR